MQFPRYTSDKIFKVKIPTARSKLKSRSHHDIAYLLSLTNVLGGIEVTTGLFLAGHTLNFSDYCFRMAARSGQLLRKIDNYSWP